MSNQPSAENENKCEYTEKVTWRDNRTGEVVTYPFCKAKGFNRIGSLLVEEFKCRGRNEQSCPLLPNDLNSRT